MKTYDEVKRLLNKYVQYQNKKMELWVTIRNLRRIGKKTDWYKEMYDKQRLITRKAKKELMVEIKRLTDFAETMAKYYNRAKEEQK